MEPALVIFDCDGVLVDSEPIVLDVEVGLVHALGWPATRQQIIDEHLGRSTRAAELNIERHIGRPLPGGWAEARVAAQHRALAAAVEPVAGVVAAIAALDAAGYQRCCASSGTYERMGVTLGRTGLDRLFEGHIYSSVLVAQGKPAPDLFLYAAEHEGHSPASCLVVEDSPAGVAAAHAAGMRVIGYAGGLSTARSLADADVVITSMDELPAQVRLLDAARG